MRKRESKKIASPRLGKLAGTASQMIAQVASLLDEEMAAGIVAAKLMQRRFRQERRIDPADFKDAFDRLQDNAHDVITLLGERFEALKSEQAQKSASQFVGHAHSVLDLLIEMVATGAELADQLVKTKIAAKRAASTKRRVAEGNA